MMFPEPRGQNGENAPCHQMLLTDKEDENSTLTFAFNKAALISDLDKDCFEAVVELKLRVGPREDKRGI